MLRSLAATLSSLLLLAPLACGGDAPAPTLTVHDDDGAHPWSAAALDELPASELSIDGHRYTGARVRDLLDAPLAPTQVVIARGADGYTQTLDAAVVRGDSCIVARERDGAPLSAEHGPLRLVVAGSPGLSVRKLVSLRVDG